MPISPSSINPNLPMKELQRLNEQYIKEQKALAPSWASKSFESESSSADDPFGPVYKLTISSQGRELSRRGMEEQRAELLEDSSLMFGGTVISQVTTKSGTSIALKKHEDQFGNAFIYADIQDKDGKHFGVKITEDTIITEDEKGNVTFKEFTGVGTDDNDVIIDFTGKVDGGAGNDTIISLTRAGEAGMDLVDINGGGGNDTIYVENKGADKVRVLDANGSNKISVHAEDSEVAVNTGEGSDKITVSAARKTVNIDSQAGRDIISIITESGADITVDSGDDDDEVSITRNEGKNENIGYTNIKTGDGKDKVYANRIGGKSHLKADKSGGEIDLGEGDDTLQVDVAYNLEKVSRLHNSVTIGRTLTTAKKDMVDKDRDAKFEGENWASLEKRKAEAKADELKRQKDLQEQADKAREKEEKEKSGKTGDTTLERVKAYEAARAESKPASSSE